MSMLVTIRQYNPYGLGCQFHSMYLHLHMTERTLQYRITNKEFKRLLSSHLKETFMSHSQIQVSFPKK